MKKITTKLLKKQNDGFTLIELLVVIMIIGILVSIALPTFLSQVGKAKGVDAIVKLDHLGKSQSSYYAENTKFTGDFNALNFNTPTEDENYHYEILPNNSSFNGAIHVAIAKNRRLKSYVNVVYLKDGQPLMCRTVEVPLSWPINLFELLQILNDVKSNPGNYC
ncbi:type IV pilin-like G/H family protein [Kamptonema animale CS-326]|jgi:prepilin-type N-terminal cleavage/methylation domain-containing protein|uniref:type IV pilin protein n=1 Tax=Kamptonema animale TaxID=92934 RepID=UPI00232FC22F|nr:type IV pilin-like G/H family protein [Kamptonema animale]MDB9512954.1 type IV pilin-like G/H family protein [Kamptonema animale CS-326]